MTKSGAHKKSTARKHANASAQAPNRTTVVRYMRARYDAAQTNDGNRRHWANADGLSAAAANSPEVRRSLRMRARYERANNPYLMGISLSLPNDTIGIGPTLDMMTDDEPFNKAVEAKFWEWMQAIGLAAKLRTMRMAKIEDGEAFSVLISNPALAAHDTYPTPVQLDMVLVEADQVADPAWNPLQPNTADGIVFDAAQNPIEYHILKYHPGDLLHGFSGAFDKVPASAVIHYFRVERPGQVRGIPEVVSSLGTFADLRRYNKAVLRAAEIAADMSITIETQRTENDGTYENENEETIDAGPQPWETVDIDPGSTMVLPTGSSAKPLQAAQPSTQYPDAKREFLNEAARPLCTSNIASGDSSGYNFASVRADIQIYRKSITVEQGDYTERIIMDRLLANWLREAFLISGFLPPTSAQKFDHQWFWVGAEHVDPAKEANADDTRLSHGSITLREIYAKRGLDYRDGITQGTQEMGERLKGLEAGGFTHEEAISIITRKPMPSDAKSANPNATNDFGDSDPGNNGGNGRAHAHANLRGRF